MNIATLRVSVPIKNTVRIPGSKSLTNRALIIGALSGHPVTLMHPLVADDTLAMAECITNLGIPVVRKKDRWIIHGETPETPDRTHTLHARLSGTTLRFILPLSAIRKGITMLSGEPGLMKRPIMPLIRTLRHMGARIECVGNRPRLPLKITGGLPLRTTSVRINGSVSSQFVSALLMTLPVIGTSELTITGIPVSETFTHMTIDLMATCGVTVRKKNNSISIPHANYAIRRIPIEPDASSACYIAAIAALSKRTLSIRSLTRASMQPDIGFLAILELMGNRIIQTRTGIMMRGSGVKPVTVDMTDCPDQIQTLSVLAAFAPGKTVIHGIQTLRHKETDRVHAIQTELLRMGIRTHATTRTLTIWGGSPAACRIRTYGDHRMAMAFAVAGCRCPGIRIEDPDVVTKTFPEFWDVLPTVGISVRKENL